MNHSDQEIFRRVNPRASSRDATTRLANAPLVVKACLLSAASIAIAMLLVQRQAAPGAFVWNFTPSVPLGIYRIDEAPWARGDRVAVRPTARLAGILLRARVLKSGRVLLKRVAAAGDDIVCRDGADVSVNGIVVARAKSADSSGVGLPSWAGCERLGGDRVLLLGEMDQSFDGRYFGPTDASDIIGGISPVALISDDRFRVDDRPEWPR